LTKGVQIVTTPSKIRSPRRSITLLLASASIVASTPAFATIYQYTGNSGANWANPASWSVSGGAPHAIPVNGDTAQLGVGGTTATSNNFNQSYTSPGLALLDIDAIGVGAFTLNQTTAGTAMFAVNETIGNTNTFNTYNQSVGTNTATNVTLGNLSSSFNNNYNLSGTGVLTASAAIIIGNFGGGAFTQSNSTTVTSNNLLLGGVAGGNGNYSLLGGSLSISNGNEDVGYFGNGTFTQSGGNNTIAASADFSIGNQAGTNGIYSLQGGNLTVGNSENIGDDGNGTFAQSGGTVNTNAMDVGLFSAGIGVVTQTGGTMNVNGSGIISLGFTANASGNYTIDASAGASALNAGTISVGSSGNGNFTQNGGNVTLSQSLIVGQFAGSNGNFFLNAGNLTLNANGTAVIAASGNGTMTQTGGNFTLTGANASLTIGGATLGTYNLSGGVLNTPLLQIANTGNAGFYQTGGTINVSKLNIANAAGTAANYEFSGNSTLNVSSSESIGVSGTGQFFQSSGNQTIVGEFQLGQNAGGSGIYTIFSGNLNVTGFVVVGNAGSGSFSQQAPGGNVSISSELVIGSQQPGSWGSYSINSGNLSVPMLLDGARNANSTFFQSGGNVNVQSLYIGDPSGSTSPSNGTSSYFISGGNLTITSFVYLGLGSQPASFTDNFGGVLNAPTASDEFMIAASGTFNFNGGTVNGYILNQGIFNSQGGTFNGTLENGPSGVANFTGGTTFGAGLINHGMLNISGSGVFGATVGTVAGQTFSNDGTITLSASGQIFSNGPVVNNGLITGTGGIVGPGTFTNNLSIVQGAGPLTFSFNVGTATNFGTITLATGRTLNLIGGFTNSGDFKINGASIIQNGILANSFAGTVEGPGTILAGFTNTGTVLPGAGTLNITSPWTNAGILELTGPSSAVAGGAITNAGTLQGAGSVGSPVTNNGTIEAIGGTLVIAAPLTNSSTGSLAASTSNKLLILSGLANNAGLLSLTGGTFDNNGQPLNNTGQLSGFGTFRTGGLTNNGAITFSGSNGATTTINGNITNDANKIINIKFNPAIFTGNVLNNANATIATTSTTATFAGTFTNNGTYSSDPSINIFQSDVTSAGSMTGNAGDAYIFSGGNVTNSGTFLNAGSLQSSDNITNSGTFTQSGPQTWSSTAGFTNTAGAATFQSNAKLAALTITGGTFNITTSKLVIEPANKSVTLAALEADAANHSLLSSALPAHTALALIDNAALTTPFTTFGGLPADSGSILLAPELLGDTNIDGIVNVTDLNTVLAHLGSATAAWTSGNFDNAATIDLTDLNTVLNNLGLTYANSSASSPVPTPEPASFAILSVTSVLLVHRRRR
jgi:fibronectin-binding autotransporter adhesin